MKKKLRYIIPFFFLVLTACVSGPVRSDSSNYRDIYSGFNLFFFKGRLFLIGGSHPRFAGISGLTPSFLNHSYFDYINVYEDIPSTDILVTEDLKTITELTAHYFKGGRTWTYGKGFNIQDYRNLLKKSDSTLNHDMIRNEPFYFQFSDKMWCIGGETVKRMPDRSPDIWNSEDGFHWKCVNKKPPWADYFDFDIKYMPVIFKNEIWIYMYNTTNDHSGPVNELWSSKDGINWEKRITPDVDDPRLFGTEKVLCYYGENPHKSGLLYFSTRDGIKWDKMKMPEGYYYNLIMLFYKNKYWMFGEYDNFISPDGIYWKKIISAPKEVKHAFLLDDKMVVFNKQGMFESSDGLKWKLKAENPNNK